MPVSTARKTRAAFVPRGANNPISHLNDQGRTIISLATEWELKTTDAVYRLKRFEYVPTFKTARRMGQTFGWSAGEVIDFWASRVVAR